MVRKSIKVNFYLTIYITCALFVIAAFALEWEFYEFIIGMVYAQIIEWFVHGWIQHHPFKIFKPYRDLHTEHHKYPELPLAVQPIQYFLIGSVFLLAPFYYLPGVTVGYLFMYYFINVIHYDLHVEDKKERMLSDFWWDSWYFRVITRHHDAHHMGIKLGYTTYSVTNPFMDMLFSWLRLNLLNNWIAKRLKI